MILESSAAGGYSSFVMDGPSGLNQPRRRSRLRSREGDNVRRVPGASPADSVDAPVYDPGLEPDTESARANMPTVQDVIEAPPGEVPPISATETGEEDDELPEAFRLKKVYTAPAPPRHPLTDWRWLLFFFALLGGGLAAGFLAGQRSAPAQGVAPRTLYLQANRAVVGSLDPTVQTEVDNAFESTKKGRYEEAHQRFEALRAKHPGWPSMAVESARTALYQHDSQQAQNILGVLSANRLTPDAEFMLALLHLTNREFDLAENSFGLAVALDPSRPDYYYFWGECLRRDGKPQEAIDKFRSALLRNQYENSEGLYQLKLWLSEIQADKEEASGAGKEINAALSLARPPYEALFAAAARAIKAGHFDAAADFITKAQVITEPAVFRVILQDPTFLEESTRKPLAGFYR